MLPLAAGPV